MPQSVLHYLDVHTRFTHSRGECMPQGVTAKVWKQNGIFFTLLEHLVIAVPDDPADSLVQRSLVKGTTIPVKEDEIRVTIVCQVIVEPLHIRFLQCGDPLFAEVWSDKGVVHILIVFEFLQ